MMTTTTSTIATISVLLLISLTSLHPTEAFASWLVDRELGCMTYLEPGEIIMNNEVLPHDQSKHPAVHLEVLKDGIVLETEVDDGKTEGRGELMYYGEEGMTVQVRLYTPPELQYSDVQFVAQIDNNKKGGGGMGQFLPPTNGGGAATVGCDGTRSSGPNKRTELTLQLGGGSGDGGPQRDEDVVTLLGGWATGHEAVTLTPMIKFRRREEDAKRKQGQESEAATPEGESSKKIVAEGGDGGGAEEFSGPKAAPPSPPANNGEVNEKGRRSDVLEAAATFGEDNREKRKNAIDRLPKDDPQRELDHRMAETFARQQAVAMDKIANEIDSKLLEEENENKRRKHERHKKKPRHHRDAEDAATPTTTNYSYSFSMRSYGFASVFYLSCIYVVYHYMSKGQRVKEAKREL